MARPLRIEFPDAYYLVSNRGEAGSTIFPGEKYYQAFLEGLEEACARLNVEVQGYCLLKNEYNLILKTPEGNLSRFMRQVDGLYTQTYQKLKNSEGSIFRARYKSVLVQPQKYLLDLSVYLHNLPRKQRTSPEKYKWSSLKFYLNKEKPPVWFERKEVLAQVGSGGRIYKKYSDLVSEGTSEELEHFFGKKNLLSILGDAGFVTKARKKSSPKTARGTSKGAKARLRPSIRKVVTAVAAHYKVTEKSILNAARGPGSKNIPRWVAMYLCQEVGGVTLQDIASRFGLKRYGTVSTTIGKLKKELHSDASLSRDISRLKKKLAP